MIDETYRVAAPAETAALARRFSTQLQAGDAVAFFGDLGSGKTFFVQQLCAALGTAEHPTSPTFTIINQYRTATGVTIYHCDFYRIEHDGELANLGLEDIFYNDNISLIEWSERIANYLPLPRYEIRFSFVDGEPESREISIGHVAAS